MFHRGRIEKRYWNRCHSWLETMQMILILTVLQVCGVASIWGYSEILGWRHGYEENWAVVVIIFMFLSAFRLFTSNFKSLHKYTCIASMMDPPLSLRSTILSTSSDNFSSIKCFPTLMKYLGIIYSLLLDFVLQILGTASIWGYSEIIGYRRTPDSKRWANFTIFFSLLSLIRYVVKFRRNYYEMDHPSRFILPVHYWSYFEIGLVGTVSSKKMVLKSIQESWNNSSSSSSVVVPSASADPSQSSPLDSHNSSTQSTQSTFQTSSLSPPSQHSSCSTILSIYFSSFLFSFGYICHFILAIILEGLGSGGAIWGISEVLTLRSTSSSLLFRLLTAIVSFLVSFKLLIQFYDKYQNINPQQQQKAFTPSSINSVSILDNFHEETTHTIDNHLHHSLHSEDHFEEGGNEREREGERREGRGREEESDETIMNPIFSRQGW